MELENQSHVSFRIPTKYVDFLNNINPNQTEAFKIVLDDYMDIKKNKGKNERTQRLNGNIIMFGLGVLFLLFAVLSTDVIVGYIATLFGLFLAANGIIGGIITEIRRTR